MGCILLFSAKHSLTNDIMFGNPSKKIKLEFQNKIDESAGNEDLWGQDDLTAEEFDMLEIQATQGCNLTTAFPNHNTHQVNQTCCSGQKDLAQASDLKQLQYELEGRIKLLSQSLEKSTKELSEERLSRERIISDRIKEFQGREVNLQKEIEKMQSILEFKEQEMKSACSKLKILKSQMPDKKVSCSEKPINKNFDDLLNSCKPHNYENKISHMNFTKRIHQKHKLLLDTPRGESESADVMSSILCNRLIPTSFCLETSMNFAHSEDNLSNCNFSTVSVVQLKNGQKSDELLEYYRCLLISHVKHLKLLASKGNANCSSKNSPVSARQKEASSQTVISCLKDVMYLLSCPKLHPVIQKACDTCKSPDVHKKDNISLKENEAESVSHDPVFKENNSIKFSTGLNTSMNDFSLILESLLSLANPSTFPIGYPKNEEIELSLSSLLTICSSWPEEFLDHISELPVYALLSSRPSTTLVCTTLKLICVLSNCKNFTLHLTHKNSSCLWCSISVLLCNIIPYSLENFSTSMILVEDFLSSVFSVHSFSMIQSGANQCISKVIQGFIICIWKYLQMKKQSSYSTVITKKGFLLLHFMSNYIPNFKLQRNPVEDEYISFISSLLTLSKENVEFKEFYDLIHDLWDFQTDISEFDLDEQPELTSTNEIDNEE